MERNATYGKALTEMAHVVNTIQTNQSTAVPSAAATDTSAPTNEMRTILAAITNLSRTTPPVVAKQRRKYNKFSHY